MKKPELASWKNEKKGDIYYTKATILFPDYFDYSTGDIIDFKGLSGVIIDDKVYFRRNDLEIKATIKPYSIPVKFTGLEWVQKEIVEPAIEAVVNDLQDSNSGEIVENLIKECDEQFRLFQSSYEIVEEPPRRFFELFGWVADDIMKKLSEYKESYIQNARRSLLLEKYQCIAKLTDYIRIKEGGKYTVRVPCVYDQDLGTAIKKALEINAAKKEIEELPFVPM